MIGDEFAEAWPWGLVIIGGPLLLFIALIWAKSRTLGKTIDDDPGTAWDDPSKGMTGHDRADEDPPRPG